MSACDGVITQGERRGQQRKGTTAGYNRHRRAGEEACGECLAASREYQQNDRAKANKRRHYEANRLTAIEQSKAWAKANPERRREIAEAWVRDNPEKRRAAVRRYDDAHREAAAEYRRRWLEANRERSREQVRRRRARLKLTTVVPFTVEQLGARMAYWGDKCWMCSGPFEHVDHVVPLSRGGIHALANLRPACGECNRRKHARDWREFATSA